MTHKQKYIKEILPIIAQEYLKDKKSTQTSLGKKYKISNRTVHKYFKENDIKVRKDSCCKLTDEQELDVVRRYEAGEKNRVLAEEYDLCTASILNIVKKHNGKRKTVNGQKIYTCDESFFEKIDSHEKAQVLGFIAADGNVFLVKNRRGSSVWRVEIQYRDSYLLQQIADIVKYNGVFQYRYLNNRKYVKLGINRKKMVLDLIKLGCVENKTFGLQFPDFLDKDLLASYLFGYWLGDGWCSFSKKENGPATFYMAIVSNNDFINKCKEFLEKELNIHCVVQPHSRSEGISDLRINGSQCVKFWDLISKNIVLKINRKIEKAEAIKHYVLTKEITPALLKSQKNDIFFDDNNQEIIPI